jgi:hypothetical protein
MYLLLVCQPWHWLLPLRLFVNFVTPWVNNCTVPTFLHYIIVREIPIRILLGSANAEQVYLLSHASMKVFTMPFIAHNAPLPTPVKLRGWRDQCIVLVCLNIVSNNRLKTDWLCGKWWWPCPPLFTKQQGPLLKYNKNIVTLAFSDTGTCQHCLCYVFTIANSFFHFPVSCLLLQIPPAHIAADLTGSGCKIPYLGLRIRSMTKKSPLITWTNYLEFPVVNIIALSNNTETYLG